MGETERGRVTERARARARQRHKERGKRRRETERKRVQFSFFPHFLIIDNWNAVKLYRKISKLILSA